MIDETLLDAMDKMEKAVEHARAEFSTVRTGRASPALVEKLPVDVLRHRGAAPAARRLQVPEARLLVISPTTRASMAAIEKAIRNSDLGLNPSNDGHVIRLAFPPLTEERRKELREGRQAHGRGRAGRGAQPAPGRPQATSRRSRRTARSPRTSSTRAEKELDKLTHEHDAEIDKALDAQGARAARGLSERQEAGPWRPVRR